MPSQPKPKPKKVFRTDIQALRALAVAAVVLYHLWPNRLAGGFIGVDIFFVISGYLMTMSIMGWLKPIVQKRDITAKNIYILLSDFYARRIRRLAPAALVTLAVTGVMAYLTNTLDIITNTAKNIISSATFWENWRLADQSVDYLHQGDSVVATQHFWSLSVEEQFYLIWPILLILSSAVMINIIVRYKRQQISGVILPVILFTIASLAYGVWLTATEPSYAYFSTPARIWELMLGGIIAFLPAIKHYDTKLLLPYLGLAMCLYSLFFIDESGFPGLWAIIPTVGTAMIIWGGVKSESTISFSRIFRARPIQWLGNISYSVYLWHFPLIILAPILIHHSLDSQYGRLIKIGIILATLLIAYISFLVIEEPARKIRLKPRYIYLIFIITTASIVYGAVMLKNFGTEQSDIRLNKLHAEALDESNRCFGARAITNKADCPNPYGQTNSNYMSVGKADGWGKIISRDSQKCTLFYDGKDVGPDTECIIGDESASKTAVLYGDSHAEQYLNTFDQIGRKYHIKFVALVLGKCSNADDFDSDICKQRYDYVLNSDYLKKASFVVLSSAYKDYDNISSVLNRLKSSTNSPLYLIKDNPRTTSTKLENCYLYGTDCVFSRKSGLQEVDKILAQLIAKKNVKQNQIIDLTDMFCDQDDCYASIGNVPVYFDVLDKGKNGRIYYNTHVSQTYSLTLADFVVEQLKELK